MDYGTKAFPLAVGEGFVFSGKTMSVRSSVSVKALGLALALAAAPTCAQEASPSFRVVNAPDSATQDPGAQLPAVAQPAPERPAEVSPPAPVATPVIALNAQQAALKAVLDARVAERGTLQQRRFREAIAAVYEARQFAPLWIADTKWNDKASSASTRLERAGDDALDLRGTPIPSLSGKDDAAIAAADVALSESIASYARQASGVRIDPLSISKQITAKPEIVEIARALSEVSSASDAGAKLASYNPQHSGYVHLREKLAELRHAAPAVAQTKARIPAGPVLKTGMRDQRVPLIRARFGLTHAQDNDELVYDTKVAAAVADFQKQNGLPASGTLTARTVDALSDGEPVRLEDEIIANMERWRWMPRDMGQERIEVNIPDYTVRVYRGETIIHQARVIVGKPQTPTPIFSNSMQFLIVNPYWNVPPSIIKKEMLPKLKEDPDYLKKLGYEVLPQKGGGFAVRQPPGERNALGWIKFMFPNEHSVYLHDTPTRNLFANAKRAFSHGCVRVDQPFSLAEIVLGDGWTEERVKGLKGGGERMVKMPRPLPIHIGYFSAFVDEHGKLQLREDIYGYSQKVKAALGLSV
jgi:murein L,D-transpeptidase YcbB/YkuD